MAVYGDGAMVPATDQAALQDELDSKAQANLSVHITDPTITAVAVTTTVRAMPGYTAAQVIASVTAILDEYLNPASWEWRASVYRNELIARIDRAAGVERVVSLTAPAADVSLVGVAPLADLGVLAVTVELP